MLSDIMREVGEIWRKQMEGGAEGTQGKVAGGGGREGKER